VAHTQNEGPSAHYDIQHHDVCTWWDVQQPGPVSQIQGHGEEVTFHKVSVPPNNSQLCLPCLSTFSAANVFQIDSKTCMGAPLRLLKHVEPITKVDHHLLSLPNAAFISIRSQ
jgi:hypothetical protein